MSVSKSDKFPTSIYYILVNTFFERFSSGGIFAILALYLNQKLFYDENISTAIFHVNDFILHLATLFGAILADNVGLYKSLLLMTSVFSIGSAILMTATLNFSLLVMRILSFVAFSLIATGAGCCRCNYNVFGANQFKQLSDQSKIVDSFYTLQFCILKFGQVTGMMSMPIVRGSVHCFGNENCYTLVYGITTVAMALSCFSLWLGRNSYVYVAPTENMLVRFSKCITHAIKAKMQNRCSVPKKHWLDHAEPKYGRKFVAESKTVVNIILLFLTQPVFWALVQQQSSRWVFQASKMNLNIGGYAIKSDQLIVVVPLFIIILIPIFDRLLFPLIAKIGIKSPLQRMTCGMGLAGISFFISSYIERTIDEHFISVFWLIPQYFLIAAAEVLVWVASLAFAYSQAPPTMKSIMNSLVYLMVAVGNMIVFIISGAQLFESQFNEFIFYAVLMFIDTIILAVLAVRYKYVDVEHAEIEN